MRRTTRLLLPVILLSTLTFTLAQKLLQGGGSDPAQGYFVRTSAPLPGEAYTRTIAGDYDGDGQNDVAYLLGNRVEVMIDPGLYESLMTDVATGFDFVTVPAEEGYDALLVVDGLGLDKVTWDAEDADPDSDWIHARRQDSTWLEVRHLRAWSDGKGLPFVFGLRVDGTTVVWMRPDGAVWTTQPVFETGSPENILDLVPLDFDTDGEPELAVIFPSGLAVYELGDSKPIAFHSYTGFTSTTLARLRHSDSDSDTLDPETLSWIGLAADGNEYSAVVDAAGMRNIVPIGPAGVVTIRAGDVDGDGDDDLVCASSATWDVTWVENTGTLAPFFSLGNAVSRGPQANASPAMNVGWPVITDLDGDGDGDVAYPVQDDEPFLWIWKEEAIDQSLLRPRLVLEELDGISAGATVDEDQIVRIQAEVDESMPGEFLKVIAWTQVDSETPMSSTPLFVSRSPSGGKAGPTLREFEFHVPGGPSSYSLTAGPATFEPLVYVLFQLYDAPDVDARPTAVFPGLLLVLHAQGIDTGTGMPTPNEDFVAGLQCPLSFSVVIVPGGQTSAPLDGPGGGESGSGGDVPCTPTAPNNPPGGR